MSNIISHNAYKKLNDFFKAEKITNAESNISIENNGNDISNENKPFNSFYESLKNEIKYTLKTNDEQYKQSLEESNRKAYDKKINDITSFVNDFSKEINKLKKLFYENNKNLKNQIHILIIL